MTKQGEDKAMPAMLLLPVPDPVAFGLLADVGVGAGLEAKTPKAGPVMVIKGRRGKDAGSSTGGSPSQASIGVTSCGGPKVAKFLW